MRSLQTMTTEEFNKMMHDIKKGHRLEHADQIKPLYINIKPKAMLYGFATYNCGKMLGMYEFSHLVLNVRVCDWLDYHGFERPKWTPDGITMEDTLTRGYELCESQ